MKAGYDLAAVMAVVVAAMADVTVEEDYRARIHLMVQEQWRGCGRE